MTDTPKLSVLLATLNALTRLKESDRPTRPGQVVDYDRQRIIAQATNRALELINDELGFREY